MLVHQASFERKLASDIEFNDYNTPCPISSERLLPPSRALVIARGSPHTNVGLRSFQNDLFAWYEDVKNKKEMPPLELVCLSTLQNQSIDAALQVKPNENFIPMSTNPTVKSTSKVIADFMTGSPASDHTAAPAAPTVQTISPESAFISLPNTIIRQDTQSSSETDDFILDDAIAAAELKRDLEQTRLRFAAEMTQLIRLRAPITTPSLAISIGPHVCGACGAPCHLKWTTSPALSNKRSQRATSKSDPSTPNPNPSHCTDETPSKEPDSPLPQRARSGWWRTQETTGAYADVKSSATDTKPWCRSRTITRKLLNNDESTDVGEGPESLLNELGLTPTADVPNKTSPSEVDNDSTWTMVRPSSSRLSEVDRALERQLTQACWAQRSCQDLTCLRIHGEFDHAQDAHYRLRRGEVNAPSVAQSWGHAVCAEALRSGCPVRGFCTYRHFVPGTLRRFTEAQRAALNRRASPPAGAHSC
jgi:hypothetical protein